VVAVVALAPPQRIGQFQSMAEMHSRIASATATATLIQNNKSRMRQPHRIVNGKQAYFNCKVAKGNCLKIKI